MPSLAKKFRPFAEISFGAQRFSPENLRISDFLCNFAPKFGAHGKRHLALATIRQRLVRHRHLPHDPCGTFPRTPAGQTRHPRRRPHAGIRGAFRTRQSRHSRPRPDLPTTPRDQTAPVLPHAEPPACHPPRHSPHVARHPRCRPWLLARHQKNLPRPYHPQGFVHFPRYYPGHPGFVRF